MLPGQGYHTPQGTMTDVYEAMVQLWLARENQKVSMKNLLHKLHMKSFKLEPEALQWEAST
jgi:hypothetical protein